MITPFSSRRCLLVRYTWLTMWRLNQPEGEQQYSLKAHRVTSSLALWNDFFPVTIRRLICSTGSFYSSGISPFHRVKVWVSFFCGAPTKQAGLTRVKTACVVNRPSPKDKSEASRFHGVTDGPLFRAAAKKKTPIPRARLTITIVRFTMTWACAGKPHIVSHCGSRWYSSLRYRLSKTAMIS